MLMRSIISPIPNPESLALEVNVDPRPENANPASRSSSVGIKAFVTSAFLLPLVSTGLELARRPKQTPSG
jgi:hypothetical protein